MKRIAGVTYDLRHLNPFMISVTPAEGSLTYLVAVRFGCHAFTREWKGDETPDFRFNNGSEVRCFCPVRHQLSRHLPDIVRRTASTGGRAYFDAKHNYLLIDRLPELEGPYAVFFTMERSKHPMADVAMFVISAYEKKRLPRNIPKITFTTLVAKHARGERVRKPPR